MGNIETVLLEQENINKFSKMRDEIKEQIDNVTLLIGLHTESILEEYRNNEINEEELAIRFNELGDFIDVKKNYCKLFLQLHKMIENKAFDKEEIADMLYELNSLDEDTVAYLI